MSLISNPINIRSYLRLIILSVFALSTNPFLFDICQADTSKSILLINSYSYDMMWTRSITEAITEKLNKEPNVKLLVEFMDTKRHSGHQHYQDLFNLFKRKYEETKFDVVITSDDNGSKFILKHRDTLFPGTPIVFCGVNDTDFPKRKDFMNITGILEMPSFRETLKVALQLFPSTRQVFLINESKTIGDADRREIQDILASFSNTFNSTWLEDKTVTEITTSLQQMREDSIVKRRQHDVCYQAVRHFSTATVIKKDFVDFHGLYVAFEIAFLIIATSV